MANAQRVVLVTGATDGIGRQTALELGRRGFHVLAHGRSEAKARVACAALAAETSATFEPVWADLSSLAAVRALGEAVRARHPRLDVLLHNAGVFMKERQVTEDGMETTFAVNHLAPFLLTHLLLPLLRASAQGRVVTVSSIAHQRGHVDLDDLQRERSFDGYGAYAGSKLCNVLFAFDLARRLGGTALTSNALHPGVIGTKLLREGFGAGGSSVEEGAATSVRLASDPELAQVTGRYFVDEKEARVAAAARDEVLQRGLYEASARLAGIEPLAEAG